MANKYKKSASSLSTDLFGLNFSCPIGAGPGYDTNASKYNSLSPCSFVESGPFYPCEPPNLDHLSFLKRRKAKKSALPSVKTAIARIQSHPPKSLILANIAPLPTHIECSAVTEDLLTSFTLLYDFVDMFVIDTFRKNNDGVAPLQSLEFLSETVDEILDMRLCYEKNKAIFLRITDDFPDQSLPGLLDYMMYSGIDGIIVGQDGNPLEKVVKVREITRDRYPIIACGDLDPEAADALFAQEVKLLETNRRSARRILSHLTDKK